MKKMRKHFRGVRKKKVIKTESVWMSKEPYSWRPPLRVRGNQILLEKKNAEYLHANKETRSQV